MALDLSRLRRSSVHDRRPWHGAAFIVESLVLLVLPHGLRSPVLMQVMGNAHERGIEADKLSNAIILASNDAETFAADPTTGDRTAQFSLVDGELVELTGAEGAASGERYEVERTVQQHTEKAGTLYEAHIEVSSGGNAVYEVNTSRYVSGEEVQR